MPTSQNGWPASENPDDIDIVNRRIVGTNRKLKVAKPVAPLLIAFATDFHNQVEPIDEGQWDEWGYAYRAVRGATTKIHWVQKTRLQRSKRAQFVVYAANMG